jgi:hypothetical protein
MWYRRLKLSIVMEPGKINYLQVGHRNYESGRDNFRDMLWWIDGSWNFHAIRAVGKMSHGDIAFNGALASGRYEEDTKKVSVALWDIRSLTEEMAIKKAVVEILEKKFGSDVEIMFF